jgi:hypothetical protein
MGFLSEEDIERLQKEMMDPENDQAGGALFVLLLDMMSESECGKCQISECYDNPANPHRPEPVPPKPEG